MSDELLIPDRMGPACVDAAIVGAGPAGLGAAVGLACCGIRRVVVIERHDRAGGAPMLFAARGRAGLPIFGGRRATSGVEASDFIDRIQSQLADTMVTLWLKCHAIGLDPEGPVLTVVGPSKGRIELQASAVILACGAREASLFERGWLTGRRPAGVLTGRQCLEILRDREELPGRRPLVVGADPAALPVAVELGRVTGQTSRLVDIAPHVSSGLRRGFRKWAQTEVRRLAGVGARVAGDSRVKGLRLENGDEIMPADVLVMAGDLVPETGLVVRAGCRVSLPGREPVLRRGGRLEGTGMVFVAGNMTGDARDARWCYRNGLALARRIAPRIKRIKR